MKTSFCQLPVLASPRQPNIHQKILQKNIQQSMTASETAILIEDSDEDEIVVEEASERSEAIVISDSEEEQ